MFKAKLSLMLVSLILFIALANALQNSEGVSNPYLCIVPIDPSSPVVNYGHYTEDGPVLMSDCKGEKYFIDGKEVPLPSEVTSWNQMKYYGKTLTAYGDITYEFNIKGDFDDPILAWIGFSYGQWYWTHG